MREKVLTVMYDEKYEETNFIWDFSRLPLKDQLQVLSELEKEIGEKSKRISEVMV